MSTAIPSATLTAYDVEILNAARTILTRVENVYGRGAWHASTRAFDKVTAPGLARTAEAAHSAEESVFHFLNTASTWGGLDLTRDQLQNRRGDEE